MSHTFNFICLSALVLIATLSGCGTPEKKPLKGQRVPIMMTEQPVDVDSALAQQPFPAVKGYKNADWPQVGSFPDHHVPPVELSSAVKPVWSYHAGYSPLSSTPVMAEGKVFFLNPQGVVIALDASSGKEVWKKKLDRPALRNTSFEGGGVAYHGGCVYLTTGWGDVVSLSADKGQVQWTYALNTPLRAAPSVHEGRVFVVTPQNELWALSMAKGEPLWSHSGIPEVAFLAGGASPAVRSDLLVAAYSSGEAWALLPENGEPLWSDALSNPYSLDAVSSIAHIRAHPVIAGDVVLLVSHGGHTRAVDVIHGEALWDLPIGGIQTPALFDSYAALMTQEGTCVCIHVPTGKVRWMVPLPEPEKQSGSAAVTWVGPLWTQAGLLCLSSQGAMVWLDPANGQVREKGPRHRAGFGLTPIVAGGVLYTLDQRGVITAWK